MNEEALTAAIAMSLYMYNVSPMVRARRLYAHFEGECCEMDELIRLMDSPYWATELPFPTARIYLRQARFRYLDEAADRVKVNMFGKVDD